MKRRLLAVFVACVMLIAVLCAPLSASAAYPLPQDKHIYARSALVVFMGTDVSADMVMFEQNADEHLSPAGLTRILVGLYACKVLEDQNMDPDVATGTFTKSLKDGLSEAGVRDLYTVSMKEGDVWTVTDLLNIAMLQTAADAVTTLVVTLAGSQEAYVNGMNDMLTEIGCTDTHFTNVYGLDDPEQYTTARDMYRILRYASINYSQLTDILGQSEYTVHPVNGEVDSWPATNEMLRASSAFYYSPIVYGRSGYTDSLGQSCASVCRDDGYEYMTVVLGCEGGQDEEGEDIEGEAFTDTMTLCRWVYNAFSYKTVVSKSQPISRTKVRLAWSTDSVALVAARDLEGMLRNETDVNTLRYDIVLNDEAVTAPVEQGQVCGTAKIYDGEELIGEVGLCAAEYIPRSQLLFVLNGIWTVLTSPVMLIILALGAALFIGYLAIGFAHSRARRKNKQKKVKRYR